VVVEVNRIGLRKAEMAPVSLLVFDRMLGLRRPRNPYRENQEANSRNCRLHHPSIRHD
jgi:hypothetical protein